MQQIFYVRKFQNQDVAKKIVFYSSSQPKLFFSQKYLTVSGDFSGGYLAQLFLVGWCDVYVIFSE